MRLVTPHTGVIVDVPAPFVERYKKQGYVEEKAPKKERVEEPIEAIEEPQEEAETIADEEPKPKKSKKK